jgi:hypothetical protein
MPDAGGSPAREVFRSSGAVVLALAWLVLAVVVLADLAVQGQDRTGLVAAVLVVAVSGYVYGCAWRPRVVADAEGITLVNPLREHWVPWRAVVKVDAPGALRIHCLPAPGAAKGKVLYSWAVQNSPRAAMRASRRAGRPEPVFGYRRGAGLGRAAGYQRPGAYGAGGYARGDGQAGYGRGDSPGAPAAVLAAQRLEALARRAGAPLGDPGAAGERTVAGPAAVAGQATVPGDAVVAGQATVPGDAAVAGQGAVPAGAADGASREWPRPLARWSWGPIAAMAVPTLALVVVVLV